MKSQKTITTTLKVSATTNMETGDVDLVAVKNFPGQIKEPYMQIPLSAASTLRRLFKPSDAEEVFWCLTEHLDKKTGVCPVTQAAIAEATGIKPPHVSRAVASLVAKGAVARGRYGKLPVFLVNPSLASCGGYVRAAQLWLEAMPENYPLRQYFLDTMRKRRTKTNVKLAPVVPLRADSV